MKTLKVPRMFSEEEMKSQKGNYCDDLSYDILITEDTDVYTTEGELLLKFRKKIMSDDEIDIGFHAYKGLAKPSRGRGAAAGMIDPTDQYWKNRKLVNFNKWSANYEKPDGSLSKMKIQHSVASNPVGFFGKTNMGNPLPCRLSYVTQNDYNTYQAGLPYVNALSESYKELVPEEFEKQMIRSDLNPHLKIKGTPFSTVTVNRNFRTGIHKDSGDYGFGNLSCLENGSYHGGYFVMPAFRIAVDMRSGDHLCCDVHQYHGNTEMYETEDDKIINDKLPNIYNDNLKLGVKGLNNRFTRISLVCYLREDLVQCDQAGVLAEQFLEPIFPSKNIFYINLKKDRERRTKFLLTNYVRFPANDRSDVTDELDQRMVSYHNLPRNDHLGKCACFLSHLNLLKHIVSLKMNNVYILEDDAIRLRPLPLTKNLSQDKFSYLGGFIMNRKISSKESINISHKKGRNTLDPDKYQMLMAMSYYIPKWEIAQKMITSIESQKRFRAFDVMLFKSHESEYIFPATFIEDHVPSNLRSKKDFHCDENYVFANRKKSKKFDFAL